MLQTDRLIVHRAAAGVLTLSLFAACAGAPKAEPAAPDSVEKDHLVVDLLDGGQLDLAEDLDAGRPVVLVFWQSWCASCLEEAPEIVDAVERYSDSMRIVGVVSGPDDAVDAVKLQDAIDRFGMVHPQVRDRDLTLTHAFDVQGTPTIIVLGVDGSVRYRGHRPPNWDSLL